MEASSRSSLEAGGEGEKRSGSVGDTPVSARTFNLWSRCVDRRARQPQPLAARFHKRYRIDEATGCWIWTSDVWVARNKWRHTTAHRASWEIHNGPIPPGLQVCHRCDNPPCVNPEHLWLGTSRENSHDRDGKGRTSRLAGETNPQCKLTTDDVIRIRALIASGAKRGEVSSQFSVCRKTIRDIVRRSKWAHVQ